jgi:hypothetical protein
VEPYYLYSARTAFNVSYFQGLQPPLRQVQRDTQPCKDNPFQDCLIWLLAVATVASAPFSPPYDPTAT